MLNTIRKMYDDGVPLAEIGEQVGLTRVEVMQAMLGKVDVKAMMASRNQHRILGASHLTGAQAREIREAVLERGADVGAIAERYGERRCTITDILVGRRYRDAGGPIQRMQLSPYIDQRPPQDLHREILRLWDEGVSVKEISKRLNVREKYARRWAGYSAWEGN